jgi:hypothetical protein
MNSYKNRSGLQMLCKFDNRWHTRLAWSVDVISVSTARSLTNTSLTYLQQKCLVFVCGTIWAEEKLVEPTTNFSLQSSRKNSRSASQECPHLSLSSKVDYHDAVQTPHVDCIVRKLNPVDTRTPYFFMICFNIIYSRLWLGLPSTPFQLSRLTFTFTKVRG